MVIVGVRNYDQINDWDVFDVTRTFSETLWTHEREWGAATLEYRIEEDAEAGRELYVVTSVTEPGCAESVVAETRWEEVWLYNWYGRWCGIWDVGCAFDAATGRMLVLGLREGEG